MSEFLFTSESVSEGHPDKVADQISDAVLDAILEQDPTARVAAETLVSTGLVVMSGEITTRGKHDYARVARETIRKIGYNDPELRFDADGCAVMVCYGRQSPDIARGVDHASDEYLNQGAGRPGTDVRLRLRRDAGADAVPHLLFAPARAAPERGQEGRPLAVASARCEVAAHRSLRRRQARRIDTVVLSTQHHPSMNEKQGELAEAVIEEVIKPVLPAHMLKGARYLVNPTGRFEIGGPHGDAGLTGRKIIVDSYGGAAPHGGGAFSGKDPSKVDRSAAYARATSPRTSSPRASLRSARCSFRMRSASRGRSTSRSTRKAPGLIPGRKNRRAREHAFRPAAEGHHPMLDLLRPIYLKTAAYGHFGRDEPEFTWEATDKVLALRDAAGISKAGDAARAKVHA
jgi:S-adenosylmethionine synthetase